MSNITREREIELALIQLLAAVAQMQIAVAAAHKALERKNTEKD